MFQLHTRLMWKTIRGLFPEQDGNAYLLYHTTKLLYFSFFQLVFMLTPGGPIAASKASSIYVHCTRLSFHLKSCKLPGCTGRS